MLTRWHKKSLKAATAYTWAVTYSLVFPSVRVPKQSFTSALCLLSSSSCLLSSSLCISHTWILMLGHQSTPGKLQSPDHKSTQVSNSYLPTCHATQTTPSKQVLAFWPFPILLGLYITFWWGSPSADGIRHLHMLQRCSLSLSSLQHH